MRTHVLVPVVAAALGLVGCADVPVANVEAAHAALDTIPVADAEAFAPAELLAAETAREALEAELAAQQERFSLLRSYDRASALADEAERAAANAIQAAAIGKEREREEVTTAISAARIVLTDAGLALDAAPAGKGSTADVAVMRADLEAAHLSLTEAEGDLTAERFADAREKADAASTVGQQVRSAVEQAQGLVAAAGGAAR